MDCTRQTQTVLVLGGRGNLGKELVPVLSRSGFEVTVLTRSALKYPATSKNDSVSLVSSDYSFKSLVEAFKGQDAVVATIATENVATQRIIVDAAAAAGVKKFLPSEYGSDTSSDKLEKMAPFLKSKKDVVDYIKTHDSTLTWTALCTGAWYDWMLKEGNGLVGFDIKTRTGTIYDSGNQHFTATNFSTVSKAIAAVLLHTEETRNQYVFVDSFDLTQNTVREALERIGGVHFDMKRSDTASLRSTATQHLENGEWSKGYYELVTATVYSDTEIIYFPDKAKRWNQILGLVQEETVDEMVGRVLAEMDIIHH